MADRPRPPGDEDAEAVDETVEGWADEAKTLAGKCAIWTMMFKINVRVVAMQVKMELLMPLASPTGMAVAELMTGTAAAETATKTLSKP